MHVVPFMRAFYMSCQICSTLFARRNQTLYHSAYMFNRKRGRQKNMECSGAFTRIPHDCICQLQIGRRTWWKVFTPFQANTKSWSSFRHCPWRTYLWVLKIHFNTSDTYFHCPIFTGWKFTDILLLSDYWFVEEMDLWAGSWRKSTNYNSK